MTNINVQVIGTANLSQMSGAFGKFQAQVGALNAQLERMVMLQNGVDPTGYRNMAKAAAYNSSVFRDAAASTGMFEVSQVRLNSATDDYIKQLKAQKLSFKAMRRDRATAAAALKEQIAMQKMVVRHNPGNVVNGKKIYDVVHAKEVASQLHTSQARLALFNEQLRSGAHQMVNWGKNTQWAGRQLMVGFTMPLVAFGAAAGVMAFQVDKELTRIAKVYDTTHDAMSDNIEEVHRAEKELMQLRQDATQTAIKSARAYGSSAQDTLNVQGELAATGIRGAELQEYTNEVMRISSLGELEYQDSVKTTIALQSVFKMSTQELTDSFNYMNAVENSTSLATKDFAQAIPIAAAPVKAFGGDLKELGTLLTAMRSRGIEATQGANAIKAAMQRLGRPSKQIQEEWTALTGTDIKELFKDADTLTDLFLKIRDATSELDNKERIQAFAGLFGTYQVTRMTAMVDGLEDIDDATTQVGAAARLATADVGELADIAERELGEQAQSISGQWTRAVEEMKIQISTMGGPFLSVATEVVKAISWVIKSFNELPGVIKGSIATLATLTALAGPLVMLSGLAANLAGNFLKGVAAIVGLTVKMKILDKETRVAIEARKLQEAGYISERTAQQQLKASLDGLTASQQAANGATKRYIGLMESATIAEQRRAAAAAPTIFSNIGPRAAGISGIPVGPSMAVRDNMQQAEVATQGMSKGAAVAAGSAAAMATSLLLTTATSNETANNIGHMLMLATIIVPSAVMLAQTLKAAAKSQMVLAAGQKISAAYSAGLAANAGRMAGGMWAASRAVAAMMGPVGWIALGVTALGTALYKIHQKNEKAWEKQLDSIKALNKGAETYAKHIGEAARDWTAMKTLPRGEIVYGQYREDLKYYKEDEEGQKVSSAFDGLDEAAKSRAAAMQYIELIELAGLTSKQAKTNITALWVSSGMSLREASRQAEEVANRYRELRDTDWTSELKLFADQMNDTMADVDHHYTTDKYKDAFTEMAGDLAGILSTGMENASTPQEAQRVFAAYEEAALGSWNNIYSKQKELGTDVYDFFVSQGVTSGKELSAWWASSSESTRDELRRTAGLNWTDMSQAFGQAAYQEKTMVSIFAEDYADLGEEIETVIQLQNDFNMQARMLSLEEAKREVSDLMGEFAITDNPFMALTDMVNTTTKAYGKDMEGVAGVMIDSMDPEQLMKFETALAAFAHANDIKQGKNALQTYLNIMNGVTNEAENTAGGIAKAERETNAATAAAKGWAAALGAVDVWGMQRAGMERVQQQMADVYREDLDDRHERAMEQNENYWNNRQEALSNRHDAQQRALDAKWENKNDAAEKYWDNRIKGVEKAIEVEEKAEEKRQKMFDAEIARIKRLNDAANTNIDFNVALNEGDFDEAAKIRNDMEAATSASLLEKAAGRGSKRTEKRIDSLEGRKEKLEEAREAHMKALEKREEAEKRHLDKVQKMREDALDDRAEADKKSLQEQQDREKDTLDETMDMLLAFTARNKKELKAHMESLGLSYEDFGDKLEKKGIKWHDFFRDNLALGIRQAGLKAKNDSIWSEIGEASKKQILNAMGFGNWKQFEKFVETGEMPKGGISDNPPDRSGANSTNRNKNSPTGHGQFIQHEGGVIGKAKNSRKGVARTHAGLHPSEAMVQAQKGEYIVNRNATAANLNMLEAINAGKVPADAARHGVGGGFGGLASVAGGIMARMMTTGMGKSIEATKEAIAQRHAAARVTSGGAGYYDGGWRNYNLAGLKPWVLEAANYLGNKYNIASIGGLGQRSNYSEHPLGRALDFMVSDHRGTQLANDVVNLAGPLDAMYVIWRQAINSMDGRGWRKMEDRGSPTANHMDHVHVSFNPTGDTGDLPALKAKNAGPVGMTGKKGAGRYWRASVPGKGWNTVHDYDNDYKSPLFAIAPGTVKSWTLPPSAGSGQHANAYPRGYGSFGVVSQLTTDYGDRVLYAHLWPGTTMNGRVAGGQQIALSASTGNSSGSHTHFEVNGSTDAKGRFASMGIPLRKGAAMVNFDNTLANLHKGEAVLTQDLNRKFHEGVDNFANGGKSEYNVHVHVNGTNASADEIAQKVMNTMQRLERRKPQSRRG